MIFLLPLIAWIFCLIAGGTTAPVEMRSPDSDQPATEALSGIDQLPVARFQCRPVYPFGLQRQGVSGSAVIGFIVDTDGNVRDPRVLKATHREFGVAALKAVSQWKFRPGSKSGHRVKTRMAVPVIFELQDPAPVTLTSRDGKSPRSPSDSL